MAQLPLEDGIIRFKANEERVDQFVNGDDATEWETSEGDDVPSLQKLIKDVKNQIGMTVENHGAVGNGSGDNTAAFLAALTAADGSLVIGAAGATYRVTTALSYTGNVNLDLSMAEEILVAGNVRPFLFSATGNGPYALSANYGGANTLSVSGLSAAPAPGTRIIVLSNVRDPGNRHEGTANATQYRVAEDAIIGEGSTSTSLVLTGPLQFTRGVNADPTQTDMVDSYTTANGARVFILGDETLRVKLPKIRFEAGHESDSAWRSEAVQVRGYTSPRVEFGGVTLGYGPGVLLNGTLNASVEGWSAANLEDDISQGQYGYGVSDLGSGSLITGLCTSNVRHGYTTGKGASAINPTDVWVAVGLGRVRGSTVIGQRSIGDSSSSVDTHQCADGVSHLSPFVSGCATYGIAARGRNVLFDKPRIRASAAGANIFTEWDSSDGVELNNSRAKEWMSSAQIVAPDFGTSGHSIHVSIASLALQGPGSYVQFAMPEWAKLESGTDVVISGHHGAILSDAGGNNGSALITLTAPHASAATAFPTTRCVIEEGAAVELDARNVTSSGTVGVSVATGAELIVRGTLRLMLPASSTLFSGSGTIRCEGKGVIEYTMTGSSAIAGSGLAGRSVRVVHTASGEVFDGTGTNTSAWNGYNRILDVDAGGISVRGDSPVLFLDDLDAVLSNGETAGRLIFKTRDTDGGVKEALTLQGVGRGTTGDLNLEVKLGSTAMLTVTNTSFSAAGNVYSAGLLAGVAPFVDRAAAIAATISLVQQTIAHYGPNGSILQFVRDAGGTALTTAGGATWSPVGEATPEHWADAPTYSQLNAAMQWAIDNSRKFVARRMYSLADGFTLYMRGDLNFDVRGAIFSAEKNTYPTTRLDMILIQSGGDGSSGHTLDWEGGLFDGTWMPFPGEGSSRYLLNISTNAATYVRKFVVEGFRTGDSWMHKPLDDLSRVCGGDSHLFYASPKGHIEIGLSVGAKDISVYISSPSGLSGDRYGMVTFDVKAMNCRRCVQAKRGYHQWSGHLTAYNCEEGVGFSQASMEGPYQSGWGGVVTVDARNCRWAVCDREGSNVTYIVNSYDIGAYLAESSVGAGDGFVSTDAAAFRGLGTTNTTAYVNTHGVNPALTALGGYTAANFRAITLKDSGTSKAARGNLFHLHASNMGRLFVEFAADDPADNPDFNIVSYRSRNISSGNITLGADTQLVQIGHNKAPSGTVAAPGIGFGSGDAGFYRTGSNELGAATGGVSGWLMSSSALTINLPVTGAAVMANNNDTTPGLLMPNGAWGLGILRNITSITDLDTIAPGFWGNNSGLNLPSNLPVTGAYRWTGSTHRIDSGHASQTATRTDGNQVYTRQQLSGVWSDWSRLYGWNNVIGTVSMSGGVPTGRLIEYGSNANGRYVRYADGTQICWQTAAANIAISTAFLGGFRSTGQAWTYPAAFIAAPVLSGSSPDQTTLAPVFGTTGATSTNWNAVAFTSQAAADRTVTIMAIGRWV